MRTIELNEREWEILTKVQRDIDAMMVHLASLSKEQRFQWYKDHQYCQPISFEKEIGGTVYAVTAHFDDKARETTENRVDRILKQN